MFTLCVNDAGTAQNVVMTTSEYYQFTDLSGNYNTNLI